MEHPEEQLWVRRAQTGDRPAFAALVDCYWGRVYRWLYGLTRHRQSAEDLTQEAFLKAWAALPALQDVTTFRPWLFSIARNAMLTSRRGPRGTPMQSLPDAPTGPDAGPENVALEREGQALLQEALDRLPALFRGAFLLWTQEDMPYADIARALSITEETARWRVCRARQFLLKELEAYLDRKKS